MDGEGLDQPLVRFGELGRVGLVGEVQIADRAAFHRDRNTEEAAHRGVVGREPMSSMMDRDVTDPERPVLPDDQAQETVAAWQRPDSGPSLRADAWGKEGLVD